MTVRLLAGNRAGTAGIDVVTTSNEDLSLEEN